MPGCSRRGETWYYLFIWFRCSNWDYFFIAKGDHLVAGDNLYHGTSNYIEKCLSNHGVTYSFVDVTKVENVISAIQPNTKVKYYSLSYFAFQFNFTLSIYYYIHGIFNI